MNRQDVIKFHVGMTGMFLSMPEYVTQSLVLVDRNHYELPGLHVIQIDLVKVRLADGLLPAFTILAAYHYVFATRLD